MLWSAPRSRSTAFFRMMAERGDFTVVHEPFSYLAEFGYADVADERVTSAADLIGALGALGRRRVFAKETEQLPPASSAVLREASRAAADLAGVLPRLGLGPCYRSAVADVVVGLDAVETAGAAAAAAESGGPSRTGTGRSRRVSRRVRCRCRRCDRPA